MVLAATPAAAAADAAIATAAAAAAAAASAVDFVLPSASATISSQKEGMLVTVANFPERFTPSQVPPPTKSRPVGGGEGGYGKGGGGCVWKTIASD